MTRARVTRSKLRECKLSASLHDPFNRTPAAIRDTHVALHERLDCMHQKNQGT